MIIEGHNPLFDSKLSDCTSSLYSQFYNLAALIGPVVGGLLYDAYGYEGAMDANMYMELCLAVFFMIFNCGCNSA